MPKISVITASYNYADYIKETIESVINQTVQEWEMIIVDDGSTDNSVEVIKNYCEKDDRIKLFQHKNGVNRGLAKTLKLGLKHAQGDWIVFLESDDTITPDYLQKKLDVIKQYPEIKFIYNDIQMFGDAKRIEEMRGYFDFLYKILKNISFPANILNKFREQNIVPTFSCVMLKKEILEGIKYNSKLPKALDYYLWVQLARKYDFYFIDEKLTNWRMSKNSYINQKHKEIDVYLFSNQIICLIDNKNFYKEILYLNSRKKLEILVNYILGVNKTNKHSVINLFGIKISLKRKSYKRKEKNNKALNLGLVR